MKYLYTVVLATAAISFWVLAYMLPIQEKMIEDRLMKTASVCQKETTK